MATDKRPLPPRVRRKGASSRGPAPGAELGVQRPDPKFGERIEQTAFGVFAQRRLGTPGYPAIDAEPHAKR